MEKIKLNNGIEMPIIGLGTYLLTPDEAEKSVITALANGYTLIDTANAYVNEKAVGRGIKASGKARNEIFLETKLWPAFYEDDLQIDKTLERLDTDYIDLMILHQPAGNIIAGYRQLEKAYKEGKLKAIGVSNFKTDELKQLLEVCEIKPMINQVEVHPYYPQTELREFMDKNDIAIQAWYPLGGRGNSSIINETIIKELAQKYDKSPAQIVIRWHIQKGIIVIPGSKTDSHVIDNINVFDFTLTEDDMKKIASLQKTEPIFIRQPGILEKFAEWTPDVYGQK